MSNCPFCNNDLPCSCLSEGHVGFEQTLETRRHQGSKDQDITRDNHTGAIKQGQYVVDTGGFRGGAKYSRGWNNQYDGPGKGTN